MCVHKVDLEVTGRDLQVPLGDSLLRAAVQQRHNIAIVYELAGLHALAGELHLRE